MALGLPEDKLLKSAPPVWAGTLLDQYLDEAYPILKSAPPVWAGTGHPRGRIRAL